MSVKEFRKSVYICRDFDQKLRVLFWCGARGKTGNRGTERRLTVWQVLQ